MEAIKNCSSCRYSAFYNELTCEVCSEASDINNPFPMWVSNNLISELDEDIVNHPKHYTVHPSGVECIQITEHMNFCLGNAMKYIWRAGDKHETPLEDLKKAKWYIEREISRLEKE